MFTRVLTGEGRFTHSEEMDVSNEVCELCGGAGTLRDGSVCPACSPTDSKHLVVVESVRAIKKMAFVRWPYSLGSKSKRTLTGERP
jgi:hypothetical protein